MLIAGVVLLQSLKRIWSEFKLISRFPWTSPVSNQLPKKGVIHGPLSGYIPCIGENPAESIQNHTFEEHLGLLQCNQKKLEQKKNELFFPVKNPNFFYKLPLFWRPKPWNFWTPPLSSRAWRRSKRFPSQRPGKASKISKTFFGCSEVWSWYGETSGGVPFCRSTFPNMVSV